MEGLEGNKKRTKFRGEATFPEEDLPAALQEFVRYTENIRSYIRQHVVGENLRASPAMGPSAWSS